MVGEYIRCVACSILLSMLFVSATKLPKNESGAGASQSRAGGVQLSQGAEQESSGCCK